MTEYNCILPLSPEYDKLTILSNRQVSRLRDTYWPNYCIAGYFVSGNFCQKLNKAPEWNFVILNFVTVAVLWTLTLNHVCDHWSALSSCHSWETAISIIMFGRPVNAKMATLAVADVVYEKNISFAFCSCLHFAVCLVNQHTHDSLEGGPW